MPLSFKIDLSFIDQTKEEILDAAESAVTAFADTGKDAMQTRILEATTPTGEARAQVGGYAGRYESGRFFDAVDNDVSEEENVYTGTIGLLNDFAQYMLFQDEGTARIEAAGSLEAGFQAGVEAAKAELNKQGFR